MAGVRDSVSLRSNQSPGSAPGNIPLGTISNNGLPPLSSHSPASVRTPTRSASRKRKSLVEAVEREGSSATDIVRPAVVTRWRAANNQLLAFTATLIENARCGFVGVRLCEYWIIFSVIPHPCICIKLFDDCAEFSSSLDAWIQRMSTSATRPF
jgi:hypothetical protein